MELLMVLIIGGIAGTIAVPSISRSLAQSRAQQAATIVAADIQLAHSMAARQRRPVTIEISEAAARIRILDTATPTTVYSARFLEQDHGKIGLKTTANQVIVYPSGLASQALTVQLGAAGARRKVTMSRAGQVRVSGT
jgi:Tfp pilus assembly protein FimT